MRKWGFLAACAAVWVSLAEPAEAFGLRVHLYIGEQVIRDLEDCNVTVGGVAEKVPDRICHAVLDNKGAFLAGTIGPDAFPDPVIGQSYIHPGVEKGRQTADWLNRLFKKARTGEEIAFAYGNMLHAAGDVFAHSYVNNYAGDVYGLFGRWHKDVEFRHSLVERYIDQQLDWAPTDSPEYKLRVPHELVERAYFHTSYVAGLVTIDEEFVTDFIRDPKGTLASLAAEKAFSAAPASHIYLMRKFIAVSEYERQVAPCNEAKAVIRHIEAYRELVVAERRARESTGVEQPPLPTFAPGPPPDCTPLKPDRLESDTDSEYAARLRGAREDARSAAMERLLELKALLKRSEAASALKWNDFIANRRRSWLKQLDWRLRRDLIAKNARYQDAGRHHKRVAALTVFTDEWAPDVRAAVAQFVEAGLASAQTMVESNAPYPPPPYRHEGSTLHYKRWFACYRSVFGGKPAAAAKAHCGRLEAMGTDLTLSSALRRTAMGDFFRGPLYVWLDFQEDLSEFTSEVMLGLVGLVNPSMSRLIKLSGTPQRVSRDQLDKLFRKARNGQLKFGCVTDWIDADLGILPQTIHVPPGEPLPNRLNEEKCRPRPGGTVPALNPEKFIPLKHAVTLSKLALLDRAGVARLARRFKSDLKVKIPPNCVEIARLDSAGAEKLPLQFEVTAGGKTPDHCFYSVILDMVRSIDGSYQWQGFSMPYPRQRAFDRDHKAVGAGYPVKKTTSLLHPSFTLNFDEDNIVNRDGFPFYRNDDLRRKVFTALFPEPFEGEILRREEFNGARYPFRPCEWDPFRREGLGGGGPKILCMVSE